jgi:hypothetical protein
MNAGRFTFSLTYDADASNATMCPGFFFGGTATLDWGGSPGSLPDAQALTSTFTVTTPTGQQVFSSCTDSPGTCGGDLQAICRQGGYAINVWMDPKYQYVQVMSTSGCLDTYLMSNLMKP